MKNIYQTFTIYKHIPNHFLWRLSIHSYINTGDGILLRKLFPFTFARILIKICSISDVASLHKKYLQYVCRVVVIGEGIGIRELSISFLLICCIIFTNMAKAYEFFLNCLR